MMRLSIPTLFILLHALPVWPQAPGKPMNPPLTPFTLFPIVIVGAIFVLAVGLVVWLLLGLYLMNRKKAEGSSSADGQPEACEEFYEEGSDAALKAILPQWEHRDALGMRAALWGTIRDFYSDRIGTYEKMPVNSDIAGPLLFMVIMAFAVRIPYLIFYAIFFTVLVVTGEMLGNPLQNIGPPVVMLFGQPFFLLVKAFIFSGIAYGLMRLAAPSPKPFAATARVIFYTVGAASLLTLVPCLGALLFWAWLIVGGTIGLRTVHRTDTLRPALVMLLCGVVNFGLMALFQFGTTLAFRAFFA